jgi:hypothetical protein
MHTMMNAGTTTGGTSSSTAANVRTWAGHRQAFPLGQSHTPLTSMPTLGRALTDGNLNEVGFVNSFLQHLAQQSGPVEDDSDEDAKYEEEDEDASREYEDDEDYYARNKKRRSRWRANYPKIKKPKRPSGDGSSTSASRRRASVSVTASNYNAIGGGSGNTRREQRSNSVSSYFAMRNNENNSNTTDNNTNNNSGSSSSSSPMLPSPSSAFGCDYIDPRLCLSPDQQPQHQPQPRSYSHARPDFEPPEWMAAPSMASGGGPSRDDLPAVPSPPPLYPVGLPSIQPYYPPPPHPHLQRSASSPAVLPPSYAAFSSPARPANEYYSPQHHYPMQPQQSASAWMPPPAPIATATHTTTMGDEDDEVLESSSTMQQQQQLEYMAAAVAPTDDEGSWLEDLLRLEQPSSAADSSSFPSTPLSPAHAHAHHNTNGQHQTASAKDAFYAELFGY